MVLINNLGSDVTLVSCSSASHTDKHGHHSSVTLRYQHGPNQWPRPLASAQPSMVSRYLLCISFHFFYNRHSNPCLMKSWQGFSVILGNFHSTNSFFCCANFSCHMILFILLFPGVLESYSESLCPQIYIEMLSLGFPPAIAHFMFKIWPLTQFKGGVVVQEDQDPLSVFCIWISSISQYYLIKMLGFQ